MNDCQCHHTAEAHGPTGCRVMCCPCAWEGDDWHEAVSRDTAERWDE